MRRIIVLIAFGLLTAACGGGESSPSFTSPGPEATPAPSSSSTTTSPGTTAGTGTPETAAASPGVEIPDSDYPDIVVADLAGGELNLRELVLEEEPVLLWFWAPH